MKSDGFKGLKGKSKPPPWIYKFSSLKINQKGIAKRLFSKHFGYKKHNLNNFSIKSFPFNFHMTSSGETLYANNLPFKNNLKGEEISEGFNTLIIDLFITSVKKISKCRSMIKSSLRSCIRNKKFFPARPLLDIENAGVFTSKELSAMFKRDKLDLNTGNLPKKVGTMKRKMKQIFVSNETLNLTRVKTVKDWNVVKERLITFEQKLKRDLKMRDNFQPLEVPKKNNAFQTVRYASICKANGLKQDEYSSEALKGARQVIMNKISTVLIPNDNVGSRYQLFGQIGYVN